MVILSFAYDFTTQDIASVVALADWNAKYQQYYDTQDAECRGLTP